MSIGRLFWWIYQLDPQELVLLVALCTILFCGLSRQYQDRAWWRWGLCVLLLLWTGAALWVTVLNRNGSTGEAWLRPLLYSYREYMETGNREILRSNFMNTLLFYPAGLLAAGSLPRRWSRGRKILTVFAAFAVFSLSIELVQYWRHLGQSEIDDVLHNTLGAFFGSIVLIVFIPTHLAE